MEGIKLKKLVLTVVIVGIISWALPASGETVTELKKMLEQSKFNLNKKIEQLDVIKNKKEDIMKEIEKLDRQIDGANVSIEKLDKQVDELNSDISKKEAELQKAEDEMKRLEELLRVRLVALYKSGEVSYIEVLLDSESVMDFFARYQVVEQIMEYDKELLNSASVAKEKIEKAKLVLESSKERIERAREEKSLVKRNLDTYKGDRNLILRRLTYEEKELENVIDQELRESDELNNKIRKLQEGSKRVYTGGAFTWPIEGWSRISSYFGYRIHPILKKKKMHTGVDLGAEYGTSIVAASDGTVMLADWNGGYGKTVIVDHGSGKSTLYGHASRILVAEGQEVKAGQKIAEVGSTGMSTGPHLHFEVREHGSPVDPLKYISK